MQSRLIIMRRLSLIMLVLLAGCSTQIIAPAPSDTPVPTATPVIPIRFVQLAEPMQESPAALLIGQLVNENGCLRVIPPEGTRYSLVWNATITLDSSQTPPSLVQDGRQVARVGNTVRLGGGELPKSNLDQMKLSTPEPVSCPAPYWIVGEIVP